MERQQEKQKKLSPALEDYLEAVLEILLDSPVARVKEIAERVGVKMGSVTPALKRLQKRGLVDYTARAYVELTPEGRRQAQRVRARHSVLERFLTEFLDVSPRNASADACAIEHYLSDESIDHIVRWFEFMHRAGPEMQGLVEQFHRCAAAEFQSGFDRDRSAQERDFEPCLPTTEKFRALTALAVGERGEIARIQARGATRQRILDRGLLPGRFVEVINREPDGGTTWIRSEREELKLESHESACILVSVGH